VAKHPYHDQLFAIAGQYRIFICSKLDRNPDLIEVEADISGIQIEGLGQSERRDKV
jgi:hypothetical protein